MIHRNRSQLWAGHTSRVAIQATSALILLATCFLLLPVDVAGQTSNSTVSSQQLGSIVVALGMSEAEAVRRLNEGFSVKPAVNMPNVLLVYEKKPQGDLISTISIRDGRVVLISSEWTPGIDRSGAFAEVLFTLLSRLADPGAEAGRRIVNSCSISTNDGLTSGIDTQIRIAEITCARQTVMISVSRVNGGASQVGVQLVTK